MKRNNPDTKVVRHQLTDGEKKYGYIIDELLLRGYDCGYKFDGVQCELLNGTVISGSAHRRGGIHTHNNTLYRLDGLTACFKDICSNQVDIWIEENIVYIQEL